MDTPPNSNVPAIKPLSFTVGTAKDDAVCDSAGSSQTTPWSGGRPVYCQLGG